MHGHILQHLGRRGQMILLRVALPILCIALFIALPHALIQPAQADSSSSLESATPDLPLYGGSMTITGTDLSAGSCPTEYSASGGDTQRMIQQNGQCWEIHEFTTVTANASFSLGTGTTGARLLVVGGGGAGGRGNLDSTSIWGGQGGGGGGFYNGSNLTLPAGAYQVKVSDGMAGNSSWGTGANGVLSASVFQGVDTDNATKDIIYAVGQGGQGGSHTGGIAGNGGKGGGGSIRHDGESASTSYGYAASGGGSSNTFTGNGGVSNGPIFGNNGADANLGGYMGGSGGGAGSKGMGVSAVRDSGRGSDGGLGRYSDITGELTCYAGGGGGTTGGSGNALPSFPGLGGWNDTGISLSLADGASCTGGGAGDSAYRWNTGDTTARSGEAGVANTGGGGGAGLGSGVGAKGGSGIVVVAIPVGSTVTPTTVTLKERGGSAATHSCAVTALKSDSGTDTISCIAPAVTSAGIYDVIVNRGDGDITSTHTVTYHDASISPDSSAFAAEVTISDAPDCRVNPVDQITFYGLAATNVSCDSTTGELHAMSPEPINQGTAAPVVVSYANGLEWVVLSASNKTASAKAFTFQNKASISSVLPAVLQSTLVGATPSAQTVTLSGTFLSSVTVADISVVLTHPTDSNKNLDCTNINKSNTTTPTCTVLVPANTSTLRYDNVSYGVRLMVSDGSQQGSVSQNVVIRTTSQNANLQGITVKDMLTDQNIVLSPAFDPTQTTQTFTVDSKVILAQLAATVEDAKATILPASDVGVTCKIESGTISFSVQVKAEQGNITTYSIELANPNPTSSLLTDLQVRDGDDTAKAITPPFQTQTMHYTVALLDDEQEVTVIPTTLLPSPQATAMVTVGGVAKPDGKIDVSSVNDSTPLTVLITVTSNGVADSVYSIRFTTVSSEEEYHAIDAVQSFTAPRDGYYRLQAWGGRGGNNNTTDRTGGSGAYSECEIYLTKGEVIYVYVGGKGSDTRTQYSPGGWNGGGSAVPNGGSYENGGGGATDFRTVGGDWDAPLSLNSRILVAAGGGGASEDGNCRGGYGGTLAGTTSKTSIPGYSTVCTAHESANVLAATQTKGGYGTTSNAALINRWGYFGYGGCKPGSNHPTGCISYYAGGGGSGWYGGSAGAGSGGGGGSSYISGFAGSVAIDSLFDTNANRASRSACVDGTTMIVCSYSRTGKVLQHATMLDGNSSMPSPSDGSEITGNKDAGFARISFVRGVPEPMISGITTIGKTSGSDTEKSITNFLGKNFEPIVWLSTLTDVQNIELSIRLEDPSISSVTVDGAAAAIADGMASVTIPAIEFSDGKKTVVVRTLKTIDGTEYSLSYLVALNANTRILQELPFTGATASMFAVLVTLLIVGTAVVANRRMS
ncbi:glycine-rich protein [Bifidobacterium aquikefiri]|uniref:glycine-rich protein n=1 Tax=Bifidobacterium aquikefiri TaxID=1653207 RepID=UPI0039EA8570